MHSVREPEDTMPCSEQMETQPFSMTEPPVTQATRIDQDLEQKILRYLRDPAFKGILMINESKCDMAEYCMKVQAALETTMQRFGADIGNSGY